MRQAGTKQNPTIGVATIVIHGNQVLIGYDAEKQCESLPGGYWQETGESPEQAAARELFEETGGHSGVEGAGVKCEDFRKLYDRGPFWREDTAEWCHSIGFTAVYVGGGLGDDPSEGRTNWRFMSPEEALEGLNLFEPARIGLECYLAKLRGA